MERHLPRGKENIPSFVYYGADTPAVIQEAHIHQAGTIPEITWPPGGGV